MPIVVFNKIDLQGNFAAGVYSIFIHTGKGGEES